jgi:acyl CoA:acetate/3-ketoacid CoA transferase alpha subunit
MMAFYLPLQGQQRRFIMAHTVRRGADRASRLARAATLSGTSGKVCMPVDLTPQVALVVADTASRDGNLYTGPNPEDTPTITEAAAFRGGIVVAQVNKIVDRLPRADEGQRKCIS